MDLHDPVSAGGHMNSCADLPVSRDHIPGCRMLVIDDEEHISAAVTAYFALLGYQVDCASDETEAHALLDRSRYAIVITDLHLSRGDRIEGLDIIGQIRLRHPHTACIVLTAYGGTENEREARRRGADAFLQKPTSLHSIAAIVAELLSGRSVRQLAPDEQP